MTLWWLSPGDPAQRTGGYLYNARMVTELRSRGWTVEVLAVEGAWPFPGIEDRTILERIPDGALVLADGLLWPGLGAAGAALAQRCRVTVLVHSLLANEATAADVDARERAALALAAAVVVTSGLSRATLEATVIVPGTDRAGRSPGGDGTRLLTVGTLIRRKGHDRLFAALARLTVPWCLTCAGAPRDPAWARFLAEQAAALGDRVVFAGDLDAAELEALYASSDIVVQLAGYEAFGMAIAEAVARGLPVVSTPAGVIGHLPGGAVIEVHDDTVGDVIADLLADPGARRAQADRAWSAARELPTWDVQAARLADVLRETA